MRNLTLSLNLTLETIFPFNLPTFRQCETQMETNEPNEWIFNLRVWDISARWCCNCWNRSSTPQSSGPEGIPSRFDVSTCLFTVQMPWPWLATEPRCISRVGVSCTVKGGECGWSSGETLTRPLHVPWSYGGLTI